MPSDAQKRANAKYKKDKVKQFNVTFYPDDSALWEYLQSKDNRAEYIRNLIRADMEKK